MGRFYKRSFRGMTKPFTEQAEQERFAKHLNSNYPDLLWTATVGGVYLSFAQRVKLKAAGYRKGCADIIIFEPRGSYHGLLIEMKNPKHVETDNEKGSPSKEQLEFLKIAMDKGYLTAICYGSVEAIEVVQRYLK